MHRRPLGQDHFHAIEGLGDWNTMTEPRGAAVLQEQSR